mgnify:CR=1 FL=1
MIRRLSSLFSNKNSADSYVRKSYSQCGEDLIIEHIFSALNKSKPSFIDIGAHHPRYINNTYLFYLQGSRGINIEPDPELFPAFSESRPEDRNLNIGIGDTSGEAEFYVMNQPTLNTFIKTEADRAIKDNSGVKIKETRRIKLSTIAEVISTYNNGIYPDLFSIDVEGLDDIILRSINYEVSCPLVICAETLSFSTTGNGVKSLELIEFLKGQGYLLYADTYINSIFVRADKWKH